MPEWLSTGWRRYLLHNAAKFKKICKPFCGTFFGVEYCWATQCTRMFWRQNSSSPSIADCDHAVRGDPRVRAGRHGGELCGVGRGADRGQHAPRRLQLIHQLRILLRRHRSDGSDSPTQDFPVSAENVIRHPKKLNIREGLVFAQTFCHFTERLCHLGIKSTPVGGRAIPVHALSMPKLPNNR